MYRKTVSLLVAIAVIFTSVGLIFPVFGNSEGLRVSSFKLEISPAETGGALFEKIEEGSRIAVDASSRFVVTYHVETDENRSVNGEQIEIRLPKFIVDGLGGQSYSREVYDAENVLLATAELNGDTLVITSKIEGHTLTSSFTVEGPIIAGNTTIHKPVDFEIDTDHTGNAQRRFQMILVPAGESAKLHLNAGLINDAKDRKIEAEGGNYDYVNTPRNREIYIYDPISNIGNDVRLKISFTDARKPERKRYLNEDENPVQIAADSFEVYPATRATITDVGEHYLRFVNTQFSNTPINPSALSYDESTGILSFRKTDDILAYKVKFRQILPRKIYEEQQGMEYMTTYELLDTSDRVLASKKQLHDIKQVKMFHVMSWSDYYQTHPKFSDVLEYRFILFDEGGEAGLGYGGYGGEGNSRSAGITDGVLSFSWDDRFELLKFVLHKPGQNAVSKPIREVTESEAETDTSYPFYYMKEEDGKTYMKVHVGNVSQFGGAPYIEMSIRPKLSLYETYIEESDPSIFYTKGVHVRGKNGQEITRQVDPKIHHTVDDAYYEFRLTDYSEPFKIYGYNAANADENQKDQVRVRRLDTTPRYMSQESKYLVTEESGTKQLLSSDLLHFNVAFRETGATALKVDLRNENDPQGTFRQDATLYDKNASGATDPDDVDVYLVDAAGERQKLRRGSDYTLTVAADKKDFTIDFHSSANAYYQIEYRRILPYHQNYSGHSVPYNTVTASGPSGDIVSQKFSTGYIESSYIEFEPRNLHMGHTASDHGKLMFRTVFSNGVNGIENNAALDYELSQSDHVYAPKGNPNELYVEKDELIGSLEVKQYRYKSDQNDTNLLGTLEYGKDYTVQFSDEEENLYVKDGVPQPGKYVKFKLVFLKEQPAAHYQVNFVTRYDRDLYSKRTRQLAAKVTSEIQGISGVRHPWYYIGQEYGDSWISGQDTKFSYTYIAQLNNYFRNVPAEGLLLEALPLEGSLGNLMVPFLDEHTVLEIAGVREYGNNEEALDAKTGFRSKGLPNSSKSFNMNSENFASEEEKAQGKYEFRHMGLTVYYDSKADTMKFKITDNRYYDVRIRYRYKDVPFLHPELGKQTLKMKSNVPDADFTLVNDHVYRNHHNVLLNHTKVTSPLPNTEVTFETHFGAFFYKGGEPVNPMTAKELDTRVVQHGHLGYLHLKGAEVQLDFTPGQRLDVSSLQFSYPENMKFDEWFEVDEINNIVTSGQSYKLIAKKEIRAPFSLKYRTKTVPVDLVLRDGEPTATGEVRVSLKASNLPLTLIGSDNKVKYYGKTYRQDKVKLPNFNVDNLTAEGNLILGTTAVTVKDEEGSPARAVGYDVFYKEHSQPESAYRAVGSAKTDEEGRILVSRLKMGDYKFIPKDNNLLFAETSGIADDGILLARLEKDGTRDVTLESNTRKLRSVRVENFNVKQDGGRLELTGAKFQLRGTQESNKNFLRQIVIQDGIGTFHGVPAGEYKLIQLTSSPGYDPVTEEIPITIVYGNGTPGSGSELILVKEVANLRSVNDGGVRLTLKDDAGGAAPGVEYELYKIDASGIKTLIDQNLSSSNDGVIERGGLGEGIYELLAKKSSRYQIPSSGAENAKVISFEILRGDKDLNIERTVNRLRSISVDNIVKRSDGVLDASKRLLGTFELIQKYWSTANSLYKRTITLTAGSPAQFEGLKAGTYYLRQVSAETGYVAETTTSTFEVQYGTYLSNGAAVEHWVHKEHQVANAHSVVGGAIDTNEPSETQPTTAAITTTATTTETTTATTGASDSTTATTEPVTAVTDTTGATTEATSAAVITTSPENTVPQATGAVTTNPGDTVDIAEQPENGIIELDPNGNWRYIPLGPPQKDKFVIKVTDEDGNVTFEEIIVDVEAIAQGGRLPHTGESSHAPLYVAGAILLLCGVYLARLSRMRG